MFCIQKKVFIFIFTITFILVIVITIIVTITIIIIYIFIFTITIIITIIITVRLIAISQRDISQSFRELLCPVEKFSQDTQNFTHNDLNCKHTMKKSETEFPLSTQEGGGSSSLSTSSLKDECERVITKAFYNVIRKRFPLETCTYRL